MKKRAVLFILLLVLSSVACQPRAVEPTATEPEQVSKSSADEEATEKASDSSETTPSSESPEAAPTPAQPSQETNMHADLMNPANANAQAPDTFRATFETTKGDFVVEVTRDWAPQGADRFYNLIKIGYFDDVAFFRVLDGFVAQFGIHGNPEVSKIWREARIQDDEVKQTNERGTLVFATAGPNTRTTQLFINFGNNANLDGMGFSPFGRVVEGMDVVDSLHSGYGEGAPRGRGPDQGRIQAQGNAYLRDNFPDLDYVKKATIQ